MGEKEVDRRENGSNSKPNDPVKQPNAIVSPNPSLASKQESKTENESDVKAKVKKTLDHSVMDGFFYSLMVGFGESFFSAFAVFLKATNSQLGLLGSLPQALGSVSQLLSHGLLRRFKSRKRIILVGAFLSSLMYIPITLTFFFGAMSVPLLILFVCLYWISTTIIGPAWNSWMGDLVSKEERGAYFGRRNKIAGFATLFSFIIAGYLLQQFGGGDRVFQFIGYAILFVVALASRIFSVVFLSKMYEPERTEDPLSHFSFIDFVKKARYNNYGMFVIFHSFMVFAVYLAGPFFTAYMLKDMQMTYLEYTIIQAAAILIKNLSMPLWGKAMDRFGAKKVLTIGGFLMPAVPILFIFSRDIVYLVFVQFFSGLVWAAFELAAFTFIFDVTTPQKRAACVAYFNVFNGVMTLAGALIGGYIIMHVPDTALGSKYYLIFLISGIMRYMVSFIFLPKIKEVRSVEPIEYHMLFFNVVSTLPSTGSFVFNFVHEVVRVPVKLSQDMVKDIGEVTKEISDLIQKEAEEIKKLPRFGRIK